MQISFRQKCIGSAIILILVAVGILLSVYFFAEPTPTAVPILEEVMVATSTTVQKQEPEVVGKSVLDRPIHAYTFGTGETRILFVGGIHGGYEWNSVLLSYQFIDYLEAHPEVIPPNLTVTVIPSANPDGLYDVVKVEGRFLLTDIPEKTASGQGRFNSHNVDLNRNFDCKWKSESMWRGNKVSAGSAPFSEPESRAIRDYVLGYRPVAVIFWHSQSNAVYASECEEGILPETFPLMNTYARASGYAAVDSFGAYEITGDAEGWLASINIPAVTVELSTHETTEWDRNIAGVMALFTLYGK
ncbi:MAG: M14 family metallopeptidase [Minisyncoccia bacterium]